MVTVVVFEFSVMRCQPLRRALCASSIFKNYQHYKGKYYARVKRFRSFS
ncbi:hypothetical protein GTW22_18110 [Vibrio cholerae]|nr:hypothetical protein [Vibrio cholerae]MUH70920.1 hypothetical protein [Vibrio cholerae]